MESEIIAVPVSLKLRQESRRNQWSKRGVSGMDDSVPVPKSAVTSRATQQYDRPFRSVVMTNSRADVKGHKPQVCMTNGILIVLVVLILALHLPIISASSTNVSVVNSSEYDGDLNSFLKQKAIITCYFEVAVL
uniref:Transmembrane protein n=1 Tax=Rhabditophanes sp. KR3021 TaxID=114890 RepID=A0AC35TNZ9_9BILA